MNSAFGESSVECSSIQPCRHCLAAFLPRIGVTVHTDGIRYRHPGDATVTEHGNTHDRSPRRRIGIFAPVSHTYNMGLFGTGRKARRFLWQADLGRPLSGLAEVFPACAESSAIGFLQQHGTLKIYRVGFGPRSILKHRRLPSGSNGLAGCVGVSVGVHQELRTVSGLLREGRGWNKEKNEKEIGRAHV